ncbi:MAG: hypothetical protein V4726_19885 [Verrucomicrobiota bacterium]
MESSSDLFPFSITRKKGIGSGRCGDPHGEDAVKAAVSVPYLTLNAGPSTDSHGTLTVLVPEMPENHVKMAGKPALSAFQRIVSVLSHFSS